VNASSTTAGPEIPVTTSTSAIGAKVVTVQLEVTTSTEAGVTTARRIAFHHPNHWPLESLARPFEHPAFGLVSPPIDSHQVQRQDQTQTLDR
jgi:hypothetical protein